MMKNKRLFAILTLVCFMFTLMPVAAIAEGENKVVEVSTADQFLAATTESGITIKLTGSFSLTQTATIPAGAKVTLNLNGNTISGTDSNTSGNFELISVGAGAHLIIDDETNTGSISLIATNDRDWNALSAVIVNQQSTLTINGGTIEHLGGTDMAYAIDVETNQDGDSGDAVLYINGGTIKSVNYHAIRAFANAWQNSTDKCFIKMTNGIIEGARGILLQIATYDSATQLIIEKGNINVSDRAIRVWDSTGNSALENTSVGIYSGNFAGGFMRSIKEDVNLDFEVTGGTFSFDPSEYKASESCVKKVSETEYVVAEHKAEPVEAKAPTCTEDGVKAHYKCENCGALYSDAAGTVKIETPEVDSKTGHAPADTWSKNATHHWKVCTNECGTELDKAEHSYIDGVCECTQVQQFTVTFDSDGGSAVASATVNHGDKVAKPADPTKSNYTFAGWYNGDAAYDFNAAVTTDTVLKAKWNAVPVYYPPVVDIPVSGGNDSTSTPKVETETTVTPSGTKVETTTETKSDGTKVETTTTTTASGETTKVETTTETNKEGTKVETTVTTDSKGETSTTVTATLDNGSAVTNNDKAVEVEVTKVEEKVVEKVEEAVKADETVNVVGDADNAVSVSATNASTGAAQTDFVQPMSVNVPVDNTVLNNVEDTSKLTLAKVVTNEDGTTELVYMGGSYDEETGTFNAKVDEDGDYILVEKADLVKIELTIDDTTVKHNDKHHELDVAPAINAEAGRTELPLRYLGEALGFGIDWNNNVVTITKGDISFSLTIGEEIPGYGTPYLDSDRTMVSARYISEMLGANVIWDPVDRQVIVVK